MASFSPQTAVPDLLRHYSDRSSFLKLETVKHTLQSSSLLASSVPPLQWQRSWRRRRSFQCPAITGGSKRDVEKLVARTRHRRSRHMKGVTPSQPDLIEELEEEEAAEEDIPKEVAQILGEDNRASSSENPSDEPNNSKRRTDTGVEDTAALQRKNKQRSEGTGISDVVNDGAEDVKGALETTEDTAIDVVDKAADTQKQLISDTATAGDDVLGSVDDAINEQSSTSSSESDDEASEDIRSSTREVVDVASDTTSEVGRKMAETGQEVQQDVAEAASDVGDALGSQTDAVLDNVDRQASEVQESAGAVADVVMDTISDVNEKIGETGQQLGQDFSEVVSTTQEAARDGSKYIGAKSKNFTSEAETLLQEEGDVLVQGIDRIQREANRSLSRAQASVQKAVRESARAARDVGSEALRMGEVFVDAAREASRGTADVMQNRSSRAYPEREVERSGSAAEDLKPQTSHQIDKSSFTEFKVFVAGASGQTGRLVVEKLLGNGASVRALVRDVYRARSISQLKDCECIEADLYNYEAVRNAISDCNVVVCAIGARAFPFDPINTYQVEYEGVLNLISAAKNQGKVKKFVLISTIGVTYLQLVPLIFWKKQAELYLQRSGLDYTIVRPGGLRNTSGPEDVVMQGPDSQFFGSISRKKVAEVCVSALVSSDASHKIVEVVSVPGSQRRSIVDLFKQV